MTDETALIIFLRWPEPGKVKTRLAKETCKYIARDIYRKIVNSIFSMFQEIHNKFKFHIFFCGGSIEEFQNWLGTDYQYYPQIGNDLGEKQINAFKFVFTQGYKSALIIGSDCPASKEYYDKNQFPTQPSGNPSTLSPEIILSAKAQIKKTTATLGPALDGGYYLLGIPAEIKLETLFTAIKWSTSEVCATLQNNLKAQNLQISLLPQLRDVDNLKDAHYYGFL